MTLQELKKIVRQGEGLYIEFKLKTIYPYKIVKEIVAMANAKGGMLLIGISDDGKLEGLQYANEDEFVMRKNIDKFCKPKIDYETETIGLLNGKQVLVFHIKEAEHKPIFRLYDPKKKIGQAFFRVADKSLQASREIRQILKYEKSHHFGGFTYGENEQKLVKYLDQHSKIDVNTFAKLVNQDIKQASEALIILTLTGLLEIKPEEHNDFFVMKNS
ncbi:MAG: ATP-binding protein [Bacteroidetes bacterium]|nr:MAG: ATP-binding protein [Bacteroidota bacterium]